jgi:hypothetical protein
VLSCIIFAGSAAAVQATAGQIATQTPLDRTTWDPVTAANIARATAAEAAVAAGNAADFLVSFRVSEPPGDEVQSTSTGIDLPTVKAADKARQRAYAAAKTSVLGVLSPAVQPTAAVAPDSVTTEAGAAASTAAARARHPPVQLIRDYTHLPISFVQISSPEELARLRANPMVASVVANGVARKMTMSGLSMIGQPAVVEHGYLGAGTVVTIDTGAVGQLATMGRHKAQQHGLGRLAAAQEFLPVGIINTVDLTLQVTQ